MSDVTRRAFVVSCDSCGDTIIGAVAGDACGGCGTVVLDE